MLSLTQVARQPTRQPHPKGAVTPDPIVLRAVPTAISPDDQLRWEAGGHEGRPPRRAGGAPRFLPSQRDRREGGEPQVRRREDFGGAVGWPKLSSFEERVGLTQWLAFDHAGRYELSVSRAFEIRAGEGALASVTLKASAPIELTE